MRHLAFAALAVLSCSFGGAFALAAPPAPPPTTAPALPPAADYDEAMAALQASDFARVVALTTDIETALKRAKAKPADPAMLNCLHLRAVALSRQGQVKPAAALMQRVSTVAMSNRPLLVNLAIADLGDLSLLPRSVKNLQSFAISNPTDEFIVNLWGSAISKLCAADKVGAAKLKEWEAAFGVVNRQLEQTRPGMRHWGSEWLDGRQYSEIESRRYDAQQSIDSAQRNVRYATDRVNDAKRELDRASNRSVTAGARWIGEADQARQDDIAYARRQLAAANDNLTSAKARLAAAQDRLPRPAFVVDAQMVEPDPAEVRPRCARRPSSRVIADRSSRRAARDRRRVATPCRPSARVRIVRTRCASGAGRAPHRRRRATRSCPRSRWCRRGGRRP